MIDERRIEIQGVPLNDNQRDIYIPGLHPRSRSTHSLEVDFSRHHYGLVYALFSSRNRLQAVDAWDPCRLPESKVDSTYVLIVSLSLQRSGPQSNANHPKHPKEANNCEGGKRSDKGPQGERSSGQSQ